MKILVIAPSFHPFAGGVEKHLSKVYSELAARGHQIIILVRRHDLPKRQQLGKIQVYRLPKRTRRPVIWLWKFLHPQIFTGIDTIHSHDVYLPALKKLLPGAPWIHTFHGYEGYPLQSDAIKARQAVRQEVPFCFCVGEFIEKWYGTRCDTVTYGAVSGNTNIPSDKKYDIAFWGRLEADTGFEDYLRGFKLLSKVHKLTMLVVGDGSLMNWAKSYSRQNKLPVKFLGQVEDTANHISQARVAFVSGYLSILEATRLNMPVVAHYGTPIKKDYLECHPLSKFFFTANSPQKIAERYVSLRGRTVPEEAIKWTSEQTWEKIADMYENSYKQKGTTGDG